MKRLLFLLTLLGFIQTNLSAQDYDTFLQEMRKLEAKEKEYHTLVFKSKAYTDEYKKKHFMPKLQEVRGQKVALARKAIDNNRNDKRFVDVLNFYVFNFLTIDELNQSLDKFGPEARTNPMWKSMKSYTQYKPLNAVGKPCFDFTVKGHDGNNIRLGDVLKKNKLVLVDFWASWCGPCRKSMPHLKNVYAKYKDQGLEIFSVSLDSKKADWEKAYKTEALPWIDGSNLKGWDDPIPSKYAVRGIPHKVLIGSDGKFVGIGMYGQNELEDTIEKYLKGH